MLHEMMHATTMTYKQNKNRRILDIQMIVPEINCDGDSQCNKTNKVRRVYGPLLSKTLARIVKNNVVADGTTMNADNYSLYALGEQPSGHAADNSATNTLSAKYVQKKLAGNYYPWLPIVDMQAIQIVNNGRSAIFLNSTDGSDWAISGNALSNDFEASYWGSDSSSDPAAPASKEPVTGIDPFVIDGLNILLDSSYPQDYLQQQQFWAKYSVTPDPQCAGADNPVTFGQPLANDAIMQFCNDPKNRNHLIVSPINSGNGKTKDGREKVLGVSSGGTKIDDNNTLWMGVKHTADSCDGTFTWPPGTNDQDQIDICVDRFLRILNGVGRPSGPALL